MPTTDLQSTMHQLGAQAKAAYRQLAISSEDARNTALQQAAKQLRAMKADIISANAKDMAAAKTKGISTAMLDRLMLDDARIESMASGLEEVMKLPDPLGKEIDAWQRPSGLDIRRVSVPLGVIGIIYESRPNVTADAAGLCLKSGNAAILRGGSESFHSSQAILKAMQAGLQAAGLPEHAVQSLPTTDREAVGIMLGMTDFIDVIIPRGGKSLTSRIQEESRIPTLQHLDGNCHIYVHEKADQDKAIKVIHNAKLRRTGICGATESLVIDQAIAAQFLPLLLDNLSEHGVTVKGDATAASIDSRIQAANDDDWGTEYLGKTLSLKIVANLNDAIEHVNHYSSHHTDCIITEDTATAEQYLTQIDSAIVMHNTSTQFADGGEFGMGAEIGIATGRLHARGPVGAAQLTTYKFRVQSDGCIRA